MTTLPSIEQCREFLATINRGRVAIGLEPLDVLDFDGAVPDAKYNCLSARNLFSLTPGYRSAVLSERVNNADPRLCVVLDGGKVLPESITVVTAAFDACAYDCDARPMDREALAALRTRMVEAGVVAP